MDGNVFIQAKAAAEAGAAAPCTGLPGVLEAEFRALHGALPADFPESAGREERLRAIWKAIHALPEKRTALCISGGGIRSATFALGILQGLARCGLLERFHFLSTVSGGGYIGSWLTAWISRTPGGLPAVAALLAAGRTEAVPNPEPEEIRNLRSYSNYLSPRLGLLSADTWTLAATYLRNLVLTWLVLIPLLAAVLSLPWLYIATLMADPAPLPWVPLWAGVGCTALGLGYMGLNLPCGADRRRGQGAFLLFCLAPLLAAAVLLTTAWAWFTRNGFAVPAWPMAAFGAPHQIVPFLYLGIGLHLLAWGRSLVQLPRFYLRGLVAVLASGALTGALLWLAATRLFPQPVAAAELYSCFAIPLLLGLFFAIMVASAGLSSRWTRDEDREWWGRASGWLLIASVTWSALSALVIFGPLLLARGFSLATAGGVSGLLTALAGRSGAVPANAKQAEKASPAAVLLAKATSLFALVFTVVLLIFVSAGTTLAMKHYGMAHGFTWKLDAVSGLAGRSVEYLNILLYAPVRPVVCLTALLVGFAGVISVFVDQNRFSLHAMYRNRLIRAYLGASRRERQPNPFTGFDEQDNVLLHELWQPRQFQGRLLPVINMALNLVGGSRLAWQERKAASFTASPLHCGAEVTGYRPTYVREHVAYGGKDGLTLGTAVTISGAAASPNMGYHSAPLVTFILTLLNVRLGAWLGNPGLAGEDTFQRAYPRFSLGPVIAETLGLTNDTSPYVYLSDGGHFENLGLYEMVLRRCHCIVVSDAGQDPECFFEDLGGAVRKIRIDLGISIEFDEISIYTRSAEAEQALQGRHCAVGRILYSGVDGPEAPDGLLIYIKPACYGSEPRDIYEYFKRSATFPHESTADQFFSESQFESYRMLGAWTMEKLCPGRVHDWPDFVRTLYREHLQKPLPPWLEPLLPPGEAARAETSLPLS